ncbi:MAG TPA: hypothetical protein VL068_11685 [Microthrixaceae bacterium]|nr:hypothetical protein [Microthrixaceae bacterium]
MTTHQPRSDPQVGLLVAVWRYRYLTLAAIVIGAVLAATVTVSANSTIEAESTIALTDPRGNSLFRQGSAANVDLTRYTAERAAFAGSDAVLSRAAEILGGKATAESLSDQVTVKPSPTTSILSIRAQAVDVETAIRISDATAQAYQELANQETKEKVALAIKGLDEQRTEAQRVISAPLSSPAEVSAGTQTLSAVNARAAEIQSAGALFGSGVAFANPARAIPRGGKTVIIRNAAAGGLMGLIIGAAISWVLADRASRNGSAGDVSELSPAPYDDRPDPIGTQREPMPRTPPPPRPASNGGSAAPKRADSKITDASDLDSNSARLRTRQSGSKR